VPDAEAVDDLRPAVRGGLPSLKRPYRRIPSFRPWTALVILVVLTPPIGPFAVALQVWSGVAEEVIDSPVARALLAVGPIPGHFVCAAVLYGLGALLGAAFFVH